MFYHRHGGGYHMSLGSLDLWMQRRLGNVKNDVPPLKILQGRGVYHLHFIVAEEGCWVTRKGWCKILCDSIRFLMVYLENKVRASTVKWVKTHTVSSVLAMYYEVDKLVVSK
jgi:hypothetical protein